MFINEINGLYVGRNLDQKFNVLIAADDLAMAKKIAKNTETISFTGIR